MSKSNSASDQKEGSDIGDPISLKRQALELLPHSHPDRPGLLNSLANALSTRFEQERKIDDLNEAISFYRQVFELLPPSDPNLSISLDNFASALQTRFEQERQRCDIDEVISLRRQALELRVAPNPNRPMSLNVLANALHARFEIGRQRGDLSGDLDEAITLHRQALELRPPSHPDRGISLNDFANVLWTRFGHGRQPGDIDEAISMHRQALELRAPPHPDRFITLNGLGNALAVRFVERGRRADLEEAISMHRQALGLSSLSHTDQYSMSLTNLANALWTRFEQEGQRRDLDDAISSYRQALELRPSPHPHRFFTLNNLANALWTRFKRGERSDLDEAIALHKQVIELLSPSDIKRPSSLNNLANALVFRFEKDRQPGDINEAIALHRQALELRAPPSPDRAISLNGLANTLWIRFERGGQQADLDEAISLSRQALELRGPSHPDRPRYLNNLANALSTRFEKGCQQADLDEAILLHKQALELLPTLHPDRSMFLYNSANLHLSAYSLMNNDPGHLSKAMSFFSAAIQCTSRSPFQHFRIAARWAYYADLHQDPSAQQAYDAALNILPQLAALSLDLQSRSQGLTVGTDGLARRAARRAIQEGKLDKAVEYLDAGRAVFWSQLLHSRSPFDQLRSHADPHASELADKLHDIATALEKGSHRDTVADILDNLKKLTLEEESSRLARLESEWSQAINEVRGLDGFEDFLRPSRLSSLQEAAAESPVVLLISNDDGSHCLFVTQKSVDCIALPSKLPAKTLRRLVYLLHAAASGSPIWRSSVDKISRNEGDFPPAIEETLQDWVSLKEERGMRYERQIPPDDVFISVLETLWNEVVKPVIDFLGLQKSEDPPVLQWCPTGLFSFLPIHAAGRYDKELPIECASDYIVSSYTPTIGALLTHNATPSTEPFKMMVVIQSRYLQHAKKELAKIEQYVSKDSLIRLGIPGTTANVEAVASRLSDVSIVHFACHGKQDQSKPLDSGLELEDGVLLVSRIIKESMPNGSLAFLCACETAMGAENLPDEAMSLAASLLFAGFRRVVATMWEIRDKDGPTVADNFYKELFRGVDGEITQQPDISKSARALHVAIKKLRSEKVPFRAWVPFIHMGK